MKQLFTRISFLICFGLIPLCGFSQSLDQAKTLYGEGQYEEAKPVFEKLVKQSPNNSNYNLWYGVCCYETVDYENAEKHLLVANKRKVMESYRYLALLYTKLYRFEDAIGMWEEYIDLQKKKKEDTTDTEILLTQTRNLLRMEEKTEDVQIIDSIAVGKDDFLQAYSLSGESGALLSYNGFFENEPQRVSSIVYTNQKGDKIYYARPSENGIYTLYTQSKLLDAWGDEKALLPDPAHDNNFPFVLSDGVTMYFASKGYESIGGYDIFITRYNTNTNNYLTPEQMGMPFNSPANDYMMVVDEAKNLGWFVTDRNQPEDSVCVYLFIPDPARKRIEDMEDPDLLRNRAALVSIRDTWHEDADYAKLIRLAHTKTQTETKKERDFEFVINDKTTCYTLNDIKSHEARELYKEALNIKKQIEQLEKKLADLRDSYTKGNASTRNQLTPNILQTENQLYAWMEKARIQEKKARNAEIRQSGNKL
jgi:tetratricopeptide (TPR) repeat protein